MDVRELVQIGLKQGGYDGLYNDIGGCACKIDDLAPCSCIAEECRAGNFIPCPGPEECDDYGECDWHIGEKGGGEL